MNQEDNNGWTKINCREDLPKHQGRYFGYKDGKISLAYFTENTIYDVKEKEFMEDYSHWQPIKAPKPPIF